MGLMDIIAKETGGERQYSDQYAISYKGSKYGYRQQRKPDKAPESRTYKAEYADDEMEVFSYCSNDEEALEEARKCEKEHGTLFNLFEVDENYDEIRTVF